MTADEAKQAEDEMDITEEATSVPAKRKAVDDAFERLFGYKWGTSFGLEDEAESQTPTGTQQLVEIFGRTRAARILGSRWTGTKRQKVATPVNRRTLNYKDIELPKMPGALVTETKVFAGQAIQTTTRKPTTEPSTSTAAAKKSTSQLDNVLAQLSGPSKMNTVQKTNNDWESFKESDKQLQDELEKKAQGKDAFLVKNDFLNRVDQRKFELEREKRDRERAKRATSSG